MANGKVAVLEERMDRAQADIGRHDERLLTSEKGYTEIMLAIAKLPTKDDLKDFSNDICGRIDTEKKRIDGLYLRDGVGNLITGILGLFGIVLGSTK